MNRVNIFIYDFNDLIVYFYEIYFDLYIGFVIINIFFVDVIFVCIDFVSVS